MDAESIFTVIFILVVLAIPFAFGLGLWRAFGKRKEIENLYADAKYSSGRVIGYTERKYDSENIGDYYAIVEYRCEENDVVWAETQGCNNDYHSINSQVDLMYHPRDKRSVMVVFTQDILKMRVKFEKNFMLFVNLIFTLCIFGSVYYYGYADQVLIFLMLSYSAGFVFGAITKNKDKLEEKLRIHHSADRNKRLIAAQAIGDIPCYIKE